MMLFMLLQRSYGFDLKTGIGMNGYIDRYGFETLLEYRFSEKTSLYIIGNMMKDMKSTHESNNNDNENQNTGVATGDSNMVGIQLRFMKYFSIGYHAVTNHKQTSNVLQKATSAYSWGFLSSKEDWEWGLMFYELNDKIRKDGHSLSGGFFVRKKFFALRI